MDFNTQHKQVDDTHPLAELVHRAIDEREVEAKKIYDASLKVNGSNQTRQDIAQLIHTRLRQ